MHIRISLGTKFQLKMAREVNIMQNSIQKYRQNSTAFEEPGILSEKLKT